MIQRPRQQRPHALLQAVDQRAQAFRRDSLLRRRRISPHAFGMTRRARRIDHAGRLRHHWTVIGPLPSQPGLEIDRETGRCEMIGIDLVMLENFPRRRNTEDANCGWNYPAQLVQQVGMADEHRRAGILEDVVDLIRLEVPVDRHAVGP